ncbi:MAG: serine/threonine-protein kinase [Myxococcales bacterium]|nr:serine/threonine-protein kinase [Myxococcales bacterium]
MAIRSEKGVSSKKIPGKATELSLDGLEGGDYEIRLRGIDAEDLESPWSSPQKLSVVGVDLPPGSFAQGNMIQLPEKGRLKVRASGEIEASYDRLTTFVPVPGEVGLDQGKARVLRLRRRGESREVQLQILPRSYRAQVRLVPPNARWPQDSIEIEVELVTGNGMSAPSDIELIPRVTLDQEVLLLPFQREGSKLRATVAPRGDRKPHVLRVEVSDQFGFFLGRNFLEVAADAAHLAPCLKAERGEGTMINMSLNSRDPGGLGKYRVIAELGHGGMADVYLAVVKGPVGFNKLIVIKQLRPHLAEVPDFLDMFLDEARLAARLNHPNVVQTNEILEEGNRYAIVMEYLDGQSFDRILRRGHKQERLTRAHQLRVLCEALEGLHYAHELQDFDGTPLRVVHRDVTPHNIFVTYEGQVKVVDFGIAKAANCSAETRTGVLKGKVAYMAPEQARGEEIDRRADIFSVGLMLWEVATGMRPWKGLNDVQILGRLATGQIPMPSSAFPEVDPELERICMKALALNPAARYATAAEMREELERYIEAKNLRVSSRDLGSVVAELFQERRAELRTLIENQLRHVRSLPTGEYQALRPVSLADLSHTSSLSAMSSSKLPVLHQEESDAAPRSEHTPAGPTTQSRVMMASLAPEVAPLRSRKAILGLAIGSMAVLAIVAFLALRPSAPAAAEAATYASSAPLSGAPTAMLCELKISASPPEARLFLDDASLPSNPFSSRFPRDGASHRLRVEAPGYTTRHELISFDKAEVSLDFSLTPEPRIPADSAGVRQDSRPSSRPPPPVAAKGTAPRATQGDDPALPTPKTKMPNKRQLDGDDPWAK